MVTVARASAVGLILSLLTMGEGLPILRKEHNFTICDGVKDELKIHSLIFNPDPIKPHTVLSVKAKGTYIGTKVTTGGEVKLSISYYGVPVASKEFDVCTHFGLKCPLDPGANVVAELDYRIANIPLSGVTLDVQIDITDQDADEITCLNTKADVA